METKTKNSNKVLGIIITACAVGIMIVKYFTHGNLDSYIMPFVLFCVGMVFYNQKPIKQTSELIEPGSTKGKVVLALTSLALISGVVVFILTLV